MMKYEMHIKNGGYKRIVNIAENILLRPNDNKLLFGEENYNKFILSFEKVLENYKQDEIYNYYHNLNNYEHGFCTFARWKLGLLF